MMGRDSEATRRGSWRRPARVRRARHCGGARGPDRGGRGEQQAVDLPVLRQQRRAIPCGPDAGTRRGRPRGSGCRATTWRATPPPGSTSPWQNPRLDAARRLVPGWRRRGRGQGRPPAGGQARPDRRRQAAGTVSDRFSPEFLLATISAVCRPGSRATGTRGRSTRRPPPAAAHYREQVVRLVGMMVRPDPKSGPPPSTRKRRPRG